MLRARVKETKKRVVSRKRVPNNIRIQAARQCEPLPLAAVSRRLILG